MIGDILVAFKFLLLIHVDVFANVLKKILKWLVDIVTLIDLVAKRTFNHLSTVFSELLNQNHVLIGKLKLLTSERFITFSLAWGFISV